MPVIQHLLAASFHSQLSQVNNGLDCVVDIPSGAPHGVMPFANPVLLHAGKTGDLILAKTLWQ